MEDGGIAPQFFTLTPSALDGGEWSASLPGRFTPSENIPCTHWIGWAGPSVCHDARVLIIDCVTLNVGTSFT
jgi:hypothetical protein